MRLEYRFACPLPNGVHARPASAVEEVTRHLAADIALVNERTGRTANAKSVLGIVGLDIRYEDRCVVSADGPAATEALDRMRRFIEDVFPRCDEPLPPVETTGGAVALPALLRDAQASVLAGTPVVAGIGRGRLVMVGGFTTPRSIPLNGAPDSREEIGRLDTALDALGRHYDAKLAQTRGVEAEVLTAHRAIARDPEFRQRLHDAAQSEGRTAAGAIVEAERGITAMLVATGSVLLRERALDVRDVCRQLLHAIYGEEVARADIVLDGPAICLADALTPGQFLALDRRWLKGLVLAQGGATSHTVILARSFGIPTLVGVLGAPTAAPSGDEAVVDADLGVLVTHLTGAARRYYEMEARRLEARRDRLQRVAREPAVTHDGRRLEVGANIGTPEEADAAFAAGAEGIGLFRTEMLFVDRDEPPGEEEQVAAYRRALQAAGGRPVIIRTLDIGGDKPLPYLRLPAEENPFLGCRAVRLYPELNAIFRSQVRALARASAFGPLRVMVPMISSVEEVRWVRAIVEDEQARLSEDGVSYDASMPLGIMVEVPSVAFILDRLCPEVDFLSIGTNDLLQYFTAVDRANRKVASLYDPASPAFVRLLQKIVNDAHAGGRWVGLCGEMGGQALYLPLVAGLGLDEISVAPPQIAPVKSELGELSASACTELVKQAAACSTANEVAHALAGFTGRRALPLLESDLVVLDGDGRTKEEAIKEIVDRLYVTGRTDRPREVEEMVWRREAVYSTGFGHGFAIPHCKTDAVRANSLAILKLKTSVEWGSLDEKPVRMLLLLAIRESDETTAHMKVLATLARRIMHEEFRDRLMCESNAEAMTTFIAESIGA